MKSLAGVIRLAQTALLLLAVGWLAGCAASGRVDANAAPTGVAAGPLVPDSTEESEEQRRARIRLELATGYYQQRNFTVALEEIRQALAINPNYASAYSLLGLLYMDMGDKARAEESFKRALSIAPNDSEINNNYGWYLCQNGRERQSVDYFSRAIRNPLYQTPAKPLHNAGICLRRIGDLAGAESYFQRAFQVDPRNAVAMYNLADLSLARKDLERARFYAQRLLSTYDPNAETLWLALRVERAAGNRTAETSYATQLRRRFPQSRETSLLLSGQYGQ